jgi:hypothetical protein
LAALGMTETQAKESKEAKEAKEAHESSGSGVKRRRVIRLNPDDLAALEEERDFLQRSVADLEREHDVGDIGEDDFATLQADYAKRLALITKEIESGKVELASRPRRSRGRTLLIVAGVVVFAVLCGFTVAQLAGRRDASQGVSGNVPQTSRERNTECLTLARNNPSDAVTCYDGVLKDDPQNVEALTYRGWIRFTDSDPVGVTDLLNAVKIDPKYPDVHAFLAIVLDQTGCIADAKSELDVLNTLNPSPLIQQQIAGLSDDINQALASPSTTASTCPVATGTGP